jgi:hypothetical protein
MPSKGGGSRRSRRTGAREGANPRPLLAANQQPSADRKSTAKWPTRDAAPIQRHYPSSSTSFNQSFTHSPTLPTSPQHGTAPFPRRIVDRCFGSNLHGRTDSVVVEATGMAIAAVLNNASRFLSRGLVCRHDRKARKTKQKWRSAPLRKSGMN